MVKIEFNKTGYDPQIDYIKGLCILFVIWTHCISREELGYMLFPYLGDTAVPIFLIIQAFHYYKKGVDLRMPSILKLWKRILRPFIIMVVLMFLIQFFIYYDITDGAFSPALYWDKRGPGSYYIFIYLELAFVIPLFAPLFKRLYPVSFYVGNAPVYIKNHSVQYILYVIISTVTCVVPVTYLKSKRLINLP